MSQYICMKERIYPLWLYNGIVLFVGISTVMLAAETKQMQMMRAVLVKEPGGPETLSIGQVKVPVPGHKEVLIQVKATAINRADTLQRKGQYPVPPGVTDILGLEASGIISKVGLDCSGGWTVGDRVMALLSGGGNAEYVVCPEELLMPIPSQMDFVQAAAIPEVWLTAFQLLHTIAKVQTNETVLIHGGASGVGTAAIQLCLQAKARPFVTAGSASKIQAAHSLGAVVGFNYKEDDIGAKVLEATGGKGVNIILDCVGSSMYEHNINALAVDGRWIVYGLMGGGNVTGDLLKKVLAKRITIVGTTLRSRSLEYKKNLVKEFTNLSLPLFEDGTFKPIIHAVMPLDNIRQAHEMMEANINIGKIVLTVNRNEGKEEL